MELTDAEISVLCNRLLDDAQDAIRHDQGGYDAEQLAAVESLADKLHTDLLARKKQRPDVFWWVHL
jgi:hypothetical protein